jgi:phage shock protein C
MEKKLYRDEHRKMIAGVCAGLSDYFNIDVTIIRVVFLLTLILKGGGGLLYIILMIVMPKKDYTFTKPSDPATVDYIVPPLTPNNPFPVPPRRTSSGSLIVGLILITIGAAFLLNEYDIIPDWDYWRLWPVIMIVIGLTYMVSSQKKEPWDHQDWHKVDDKNKPSDSDKDNSSNDNPPTV